MDKHWMVDSTLVRGFLFGAILAILGLSFYQWQWWVLMFCGAVLNRRFNRRGRADA